MSIGDNNEIARVYPVLTRKIESGSIGPSNDIVRVYPVLTRINRVSVYWT